MAETRDDGMTNMSAINAAAVMGVAAAAPKMQKRCDGSFLIHKTSPISLLLRLKSFEMVCPSPWAIMVCNKTLDRLSGPSSWSSSPQHPNIHPQSEGRSAMRGTWNLLFRVMHITISCVWLSKAKARIARRSSYHELPRRTYGYNTGKERNRWKP